MDEALKQYLEAMEARVVERVTERVGGRIDAAEERMKDHVRKSVHDLEAKVLTEFHKWGRTSDMRTRQAMTNVSLLNERMLAVEDRVSALERGDAGPGKAA